jgi:uncharacterized membrane-anchored protein
VKPLPLADVLAKLDVAPERAAEVLRAHDAPLPWYVRALTGALGWAAAGSFLAAVNWTTPQPVRFGVGLAALVVALVLRRKFDRGFFGHLALALALFGEAMSIDASSVLPLSFVGERLFAIGVELVLFVFYRDALMRFMCTIAAWSFGMRLYEDLLPQATVDIPLLVAFASALLAFRLRRAAFAYGTAFFTFGLMLGTLQSWHPLVLGPYGKWLVAAVLLVEVLLVLREGKAPPKLALAAVAGCFALGVVTLGSPGVLVAVAFLVGAFNRRDTRLLAASAVFLLIFGSHFYYQLQLSLLEKSGVLAATGLLFLFLWKLVDTRAQRSEPAPLERFALPMSIAMALLLVNVLIAQKERVLATGETVLLELRPVDPRSMMEGDYMALRYRLADQTSPRRSGRMVVTLDARHVASFVRFDDKRPLQPGEHLLRYRERDGRLKLGAEAFYFQEGHAQRYQGAFYGELRVTPSGDSVLVGLRDKDLGSLGGPESFRFRR